MILWKRSVNNPNTIFDTSIYLRKIGNKPFFILLYLIFAPILEPERSHADSAIGNDSSLH